MLVQYPEETGFSTVDKYSTVYFGVAIWDRLSAHHVRTGFIGHGMLWEVVSQVFGSNLTTLKLRDPTWS